MSLFPSWGLLRMKAEEERVMAGTHRETRNHSVIIGLILIKCSERENSFPFQFTKI